MVVSDLVFGSLSCVVLRDVGVMREGFIHALGGIMGPRRHCRHSIKVSKHWEVKRLAAGSGSKERTQPKVGCVC